MGGSIEPPFLMPKENHTVGQRGSRQLDNTAYTKHQTPAVPETTMPNRSPGVGLFTAENIASVIRAIPESDGTYRDVARKSEQYGGCFHHNTMSNWVKHGQADIEAGQPFTAYARFTKLYQELIAEHCQPDNNRTREMDRALEILKRTCECGNDKMLLPNGSLGDTCQGCQDLDTRQRP